MCGGEVSSPSPEPPIGRQSAACSATGRAASSRIVRFTERLSAEYRINSVAAFHLRDWAILRHSEDAPCLRLLLKGSRSSVRFLPAEQAKRRASAAGHFECASAIPASPGIAAANWPTDSQLFHPVWVALSCFRFWIRYWFGVSTGG